MAIGIARERFFIHRHSNSVPVAFHCRFTHTGSPCGNLQSGRSCLVHNTVAPFANFYDWQETPRTVMSRWQSGAGDRIQHVGSDDNFPNSSTLATVRGICSLTLESVQCWDVLFKPADDNPGAARSRDSLSWALFERRSTTVLRSWGIPFDSMVSCTVWGVLPRTGFDIRNPKIQFVGALAN